MRRLHGWVEIGPGPPSHGMPIFLEGVAMNPPSEAPSGDGATEPRKGTPNPRLDEAEFRRRFRTQFQDPAFDSLASELDRLATAAWDAYSNHRKAPRTRKAGPGFHDPDYELAIDWIAAREAVKAAQLRHDDAKGPARFLLISGSSRSEHTCPSEMSKSFRLVQIARDVLAAAPSVEVEVLELHRLASEYGRHIHPCKACFSTSPALCHWPCSCYPNYSLQRRVLLAAQGLARELDEVMGNEPHAEHGIDLAAPQRPARRAPERTPVIRKQAHTQHHVGGKDGTLAQVGDIEPSARRRSEAV